MFTSTPVKATTESERAALQMIFFKSMLEVDQSEERLAMLEKAWGKWLDEKQLRLTDEERGEWNEWNDKGEDACGPVRLWAQLDLGLTWQQAKDHYNALYGVTV